jgi:hypothetical protein
MVTPHKLFSALVLFSCLSSAGQLLAAPPVVEIVAMPHPPVKAALSPLREWLAAQGKKVTVKEIDSESAEGVKRMQSVKLSGHIPVLILIDGHYRTKRQDGSTVEFINFPNQPNTPPGARGNWTTNDVQAALAEKSK